MLRKDKLVIPGLQLVNTHVTPAATIVDGDDVTLVNSHDQFAAQFFALPTRPPVLLVDLKSSCSERLPRSILHLHDVNMVVLAGDECLVDFPGTAVLDRHEILLCFSDADSPHAVLRAEIRQSASKLLFATLFQGEPKVTLVDVVVSLTMAAFPLWAVRYGKGLALGDVKFAAVLGAAAGLVHPFAGLLVAWCATLAAGVFALGTQRRRLALGPWLWAGYVAASAVATVFVQVLETGGHTWPARP